MSQSVRQSVGELYLLTLSAYFFVFFQILLWSTTFLMVLLILKYNGAYVDFIPGVVGNGKPVDVGNVVKGAVQD